ncbi:MAG: hypothetical protein ABSE62_07995 [Chthoniobacteraceae bacterium]|jgi:hypothetical protein
MHVLRIQRRQNLTTVSSLYSELEKCAPRCAVQVPSDLDEYRLCGKGDFLQFLLTWAEWCPDAPIITHIAAHAPNSSIVAQLKKLFGEEHGFLLGLITRRFGLVAQRRFLNAKQEELPASLVEEAFATCELLRSGVPLLKRTRGFLALDDQINDDDRILNAYTNVYRRRNPDYCPMKEGFSELLFELFKRAPSKALHRDVRNWNSLQRFIEQVVLFTYEVFENADRWGPRPYEKSIRGILVHLHFRESRGERPFRTQVGDDNGPLGKYLNRFSGPDGFERTSFLELTVFDNGPTLATHFLGREPKSLLGNNIFRTTYERRHKSFASKIQPSFFAFRFFRFAA